MMCVPVQNSENRKPDDPLIDFLYDQCYNEENNSFSR